MVGSECTGDGHICIQVYFVSFPRVLASCKRVLTSYTAVQARLGQSSGLWSLGNCCRVFRPQEMWIGVASNGASLVAQRVQNLPTMQGTWVQTLGWEDTLEKGMATHSSILEASNIAQTVKNLPAVS